MPVLTEGSYWYLKKFKEGSEKGLHVYTLMNDKVLSAGCTPFDEVSLTPLQRILLLQVRLQPSLLFLCLSRLPNCFLVMQRWSPNSHEFQEEACEQLKLGSLEIESICTVSAPSPTKSKKNKARKSSDPSMEEALVVDLTTEKSVKVGHVIDLVLAFRTD